MSFIASSLDSRGVATLTLSRPERRNALDQTMVSELIEALRRIDEDAQTRLLVLAGAGAAFCAGGDIDWMKRVAAETLAANERDAILLAELMRGLDTLRKPTIARIHGAAYGGGVGLVACCDIAIAADTASFCLSEVKIGLTPSVIGPYVQRAIGVRQARRYFLTAEVISAAHARELGLVHEISSAEELDARVARTVDALLAGAPGAQAEAKASSALFAERPIDDALIRETAKRIAARRASAEGEEGLAAFLEKRAPRWRRDRNGEDVS
ncbi:enoyl-CoA hydratase/isomerase family protein [Methylosinus sp. H3A]|uniref:enoyl-CoA hydratase-related protein n=1 Tax=Methylosinus sp. H3A TaxID=2785786 RepID=UPI0018C28642|nr:enoyl-CoA hydratase-related protein [Methylosinus sp. H3A]MBG0809777.1 enoyl-CoA hydratase/isomerase family protein [Methylosinus sp. H3A]